MAQELPKVAGVEMTSEINLMINTTPDGETATYNDMGIAFKNISTAINESVYSAVYLADGGFGSSTVTGAAPTISLTGDYNKTDPVCQYLNGIQFEIGAKRVTDIKLTRGGKTITCSATLTSVQIAGGESNSPNSVSVTIALNGKPKVENAVSG
ncbi:MAG: phage tail tube protein [Ruminiclostridium sp.]